MDVSCVAKQLWHIFQEVPDSITYAPVPPRSLLAVQKYRSHMKISESSDATESPAFGNESLHSVFHLQ